MKNKFSSLKQKIIESSLYKKFEPTITKWKNKWMAFYEKYREHILAFTFLIPVLLLFFEPLFTSGWRNVPTKYFLTSFTYVFIYATVALTLNMEIGYLGIPNFGKVAFIMVGAYAFAMMQIHLTNNYGYLGKDYIALLSILAAMIITGLFGVLLTFPTLKLKEDYLAIVTIVAGEILRNIANNEEALGGFSGFPVSNPIFIEYNGFDKMKQFYLSTVAFFVVIVVILVSWGAYEWYLRSYAKIFDIPHAKKLALGRGLTFGIVLTAVVILLNYKRKFSDHPIFIIDALLLFFLFSLLFYKAVWQGRIAIPIPWYNRARKKPIFKTIKAQLNEQGFFILFLVISAVFYVLGLLNGTNQVINFNIPYWYMMLASMGMLALTFWVFEEIYYSPFGRALRAIREDDTSAAAVGKNLFKFKLNALIISSVFSGFAGALFAMQIASVNPFAFLPLITFTIYIMVIIGGTGNNKGVIYGTILIQLLILATRKLADRTFYYPFFTSKPVVPGITREANPFNLALIVVGLGLIVFLIYAPQGIYAEKRYAINEVYRDIYKMEKSKLTEEEILEAQTISVQEEEDGEIVFELEAQDIHRYFGGVKALNGAYLAVEKGKLTALIGPNGSGKSTFFNVITGWLEPHPLKDSSKIKFKSHGLIGEEPDKIALLGMMRTFQHTRNFPKLTVLENMLISPAHQSGENVLNVFLNKRKWLKEEAKYIERALTILKFLEIDHVADQLAEELSGGQQKLLALGRLLMTQPKLLLLDEPVAGVNPTLANKIFDFVVNLKNEQGIDVLLIEHNMDVVMSFSDEIFVLADGKVIAQGTSEEIRNNRKVLDAYLGESPEEA